MEAPAPGRRGVARRRRASAPVVAAAAAPPQRPAASSPGCQRAMEPAARRPSPRDAPGERHDAGMAVCSSCSRGAGGARGRSRPCGTRPRPVDPSRPTAPSAAAGRRVDPQPERWSTCPRPAYYRFRVSFRWTGAQRAHAHRGEHGPTASSPSCGPTWSCAADRRPRHRAATRTAYMAVIGNRGPPPPARSVRSPLRRDRPVGDGDAGARPHSACATCAGPACTPGARHLTADPRCRRRLRPGEQRAAASCTRRRRPLQRRAEPPGRRRPRRRYT